jgi:sugar phosphate isomerase/epimerase
MEWALGEPMQSRREFVKSSAATLLTRLPLPGERAGRPPLAFSTLGCPDWEWKKILDFASEHEFEGIELRGLEGYLDLPSHPIFAVSRVAQTRQEIQARNLKIACVSSSANLYIDDSAERERQLEDARRCVDLASSLGSPYVRVFGGKAESDKNPVPDAATKSRVAAGLRQLGEYGGPRNVTVVIESHDHFTASATLKDVLRLADSQHVGLLWDAHHTFATSGEEPEFTVKELGAWIRHVHLKDSVGSGANRNYVLTGRGNVPVKRQDRALQSIGVQGVLLLRMGKAMAPGNPRSRDRHRGLCPCDEAIPIERGSWDEVKEWKDVSASS